MYINLALLPSPDKAQKHKIRTPGNYPEESINQFEIKKKPFFLILL